MVLRGALVGGLFVAAVGAQDTAGEKLWPIAERPDPLSALASPCDASASAVSGRFGSGQCPVDCGGRDFVCGDGTAIPYWRQCDGVNDCSTDGDGGAVTVGSQCQHIAGEAISCATDEVGSGCMGFIDKMAGGGIQGLRADGTPYTNQHTAAANQKVKILVTDTLQSSFRWDYHRAVIEGLTSSECELYQQKEAVFEDPYVMELSAATELLPEDLGSAVSYAQFFGQAPPTIRDGIGSARLQVESDKRVYIELKPTTGFVGMVTFNYTIKSCEATREYLHTPCALQKFDSGPVPVVVQFRPHDCSICTTDDCNAKLASGTYSDEDWGAFNYCGDHGTCYPVGGAYGDERSTGCECELGWRGQRCDIQVESERDEEESSIWTLVFGLLIIALIAIFVNKFIVLGEPLPLIARPLDWPCIVEVCPCFKQFIKLPEGVRVVKPGEDPYPDVDGWTKSVDEEGAVYYCNDTTLETRWPEEMDTNQEYEEEPEEPEEPEVPEGSAVPPALPVAPSAPAVPAEQRSEPTVLPVEKVEIPATEPAVPAIPAPESSEPLEQPPAPDIPVPAVPEKGPTNP